MYAIINRYASDGGLVPSEHYKGGVFVLRRAILVIHRDGSYELKPYTDEQSEIPLSQVRARRRAKKRARTARWVMAVTLLVVVVITLNGLGLGADDINKAPGAIPEELITATTINVTGELPSVYNEWVPIYADAEIETVYSADDGAQEEMLLECATIPLATPLAMNAMYSRGAARDEEPLLMEEAVPTPVQEVVVAVSRELLMESPVENILLRDFSTRHLVPIGERRSNTTWTMFVFMRDQGWSYCHNVGVLGNFMTECSMRYTPNYSAYHKGIVQWEPRRWNRLVEQGFDMDTLLGQLEAMIWELENHYSGVYERFLAAESMEASLRIFTREYEVGGHFNMRLFYAEQFAEILSEYRY
jgi:hypothetical protein